MEAYDIFWEQHLCYIVAIIRDRIQELLSGNSSFSRLFPMTATQISPRPCAGGQRDLVCRPLIAMAARGFDRSCLLQMQDDALRFASQSLQHNKSVRPHKSLWAVVDEQLGGFGQPHADLSSGHIAAYMRTKAFFSQLSQRDILFDIAALSGLNTEHEVDAGPRTRWLANALVGLQRDADRLVATTPMFATEIAAQVRNVVVKYPERGDLSSAMHEVVMRTATMDDEQADAEECPRTSFS